MRLYGTGCFNPRARVGRDALVADDLTRRHEVSIHAPAWGATLGFRQAKNPALVSIHAPAWGATDEWEPSWSDAEVSIHAPAWGATARRGHC